MVKKILVEVDLGMKAVEKRDIFVYFDDKLEESHFDASYEDIYKIADMLRKKYPGAQLEVSCRGEDCCGGKHTWNLEI